MASIHKLRKLGEDQSGEKAGVEFSRDTLRLLGFLEDGELVERPNLAIQTDIDEGRIVIDVLDGS